MNAPAPRPSVISEVRAWIGVGVVLVLNGFGMVWWAASQTAEIRQLREMIGELKIIMADRYSAADGARDQAAIHRRIDDHEGRLRSLESSRVRNER